METPRSLRTEGGQVRSGRMNAAGVEHSSFKTPKLKPETSHGLISMWTFSICYLWHPNLSRKFHSFIVFDAPTWKAQALLWAPHCYIQHRFLLTTYLQFYVPTPFKYLAYISYYNWVKAECGQQGGRGKLRLSLCLLLNGALVRLCGNPDLRDVR